MPCNNYKGFLQWIRNICNEIWSKINFLKIRRHLIKTAWIHTAQINLAWLYNSLTYNYKQKYCYYLLNNIY